MSTRPRPRDSPEKQTGAANWLASERNTMAQSRRLPGCHFPFRFAASAHNAAHNQPDVVYLHARRHTMTSLSLLLGQFSSAGGVARPAKLSRAAPSAGRATNETLLLHSSNNQVILFFD